MSLEVYQYNYVHGIGSGYATSDVMGISLGRGWRAPANKSICFAQANVSGVLLATLIAVSATLAAEPNAQRQAELKNLLVQDCGSCHGLTFRGGLGPPLRPEALEGKPTAFLVATILYGRPGTPMPPWHPFMNEAEVTWLVEQLRMGIRP